MSYSQSVTGGLAERDSEMPKADGAPGLKSEVVSGTISRPGKVLGGGLFLAPLTADKVVPHPGHGGPGGGVVRHFEKIRGKEG